MDLTFEEVFKMHNKMLKISGTDPNTPNGLKWFLHFLITYGGDAMYLLMMIYNIMYIDLKSNNITQAAKNGIVSAVIISVFLQYCLLIWKKNLLTSLFNKVKLDYKKISNLDYEDQKIVLKYAKKIIWIENLWVVITFLGTLNLVLKNIILHAYYFFRGDFHLIHLYEFVYPTIINDRKDNLVVYCVLYALFFVYSINSAVVYCCFTPLGPSFMLHACGQIEILTKRIENLFRQNLLVEEILEKLRSVAIELQKIYNFVEEIKDTFRVAYELVLKVTSILLPITTYEVIEAFQDGEISLEFLIFIVGSIGIAATPCYYGELLMEKGEMFQTTLYCCGWERNYDRATRTMILLLMQRASRPIAIRTIFRTLCLDTLTDFCRQSYAIFNLINTLWD